MSIGMAFRLTSILAFGAGAIWMLMPEAVMATWGAEPTPLLLFQARQQAALLLAAGLLFWVARDSGPSPARRAIIVGGFWAGIFVAFIWLDAVTGGTLPAVGLVGFIVGVLVTVVFGAAGASDVGRRPGQRGGGRAATGEGVAREGLAGDGVAGGGPGDRGSGGRERSRGPGGRRRRQARPGPDRADEPGTTSA
jgi:hypothetical protein